MFGFEIKVVDKRYVCGKQISSGLLCEISIAFYLSSFLLLFHFCFSLYNQFLQCKKEVYLGL